MSDSHSEPETELQSNILERHGVYTRQCPTITWTTGGTARDRVIESKAVLGSRDGVDIFIADPTVSRVHAEFDLRPDGLWVVDVGSKNGTYVDGVRVGSACVRDGGTLRVGNTEILVRYGKAPMPVDVWPDDHFGELVGRSLVMRSLFATLAKVAKSEDPVLIHGETGTGKEAVAREVHRVSTRAAGPFVVVDCGALSADLLESELFGHSKGAFTGAVVDRVGVLESANGGTVLLDEVGELPMDLQPKLLRVLESHTVRPVGDTSYRSIDVRFMAATHRALLDRVNDGAFREDLYFRLSTLPVYVPALRDREEDIPLLVAKLLPGISVGAAFLRELAERPWPGNVRELRNMVRRAHALGVDGAFGSGPSGRATAAALTGEAFGAARERAIADFEVRYIKELLVRHHHNVSAAAEAAGMARGYLHRIIRKHDL